MLVAEIVHTYYLGTYYNLLYTYRYNCRYIIIYCIYEVVIFPNVTQFHLNFDVNMTDDFWPSKNKHRWQFLAILYVVFWDLI